MMPYDPDDSITTAVATRPVLLPVIVHNPYFATQLCRMCEEIGVDTPAAHEATAYVSWIDPKAISSYLCCMHFAAVFGGEARDVCALDEMAS